MSAVRTRVTLDDKVRARAGCVTLRRAYSTGTIVGLYRSLDAGLESDPEYPWSTICEEHGGVSHQATLALATESLRHPEKWCPDCQEKKP